MKEGERREMIRGGEGEGRGDRKGRWGEEIGGGRG